MTETWSVRRQAPAKINLALAVAPPNPKPPEGDGLHPIASWMAAVDLFDDVSVARLPEDRTSRYAIRWHAKAPRASAIDWSISKDLAVRAHLLLEETVGRRLPAAITVEKRIPVGAGLAGGSSDAAATLLAVNEMFELGLSASDLRTLAMKLGSDIAFFLTDSGEAAPRPAMVEGVGDRIERMPPVQTRVAAPALALILPDFDCSTPAVYRAFDARGEQPFHETWARSIAQDAKLDPDALFNDLALPAMAVQPRLAELHGAAQEALSRPVHVTGSGSGMFVVLDDDADATVKLLRSLDDLRSCAIVPARIL